EGVDAIVLDPVDASAVSSALSKAQAKKIPVISYDRFFEGADYYTSFDNRKIGNLQGQAVLDGLEAEGTDPKSGPVWMVNGDPKDPNAADFKAGAEETLEAAGVVEGDRKSTRLNSSHVSISYAVCCLTKTTP